MDVEELRSYCLSKKGVEESFPFDDSTLVFKVMAKVFCLCGLDRVPLQFNVKCDPEKAIELRENFSGVLPGYHMNKRYWNTVVLDGSFGKEDAFSWIDASYDLIVAGLSTRIRKELAELP